MNFSFVRIGCKIVDEVSWPDAPLDAFIVGIKELPDEDRPLQHRHIYFGHAYKVRNIAQHKTLASKQFHIFDYKTLLPPSQQLNKSTCVLNIKSEIKKEDNFSICLAYFFSSVMHAE